MKEKYSSESFIAVPCAGMAINSQVNHLYQIKNRETREIVDFGTDQDSYLPERKSGSHTACPPCVASIFGKDSIYDEAVADIAGNQIPVFEKFLEQRLITMINKVGS